MKRSLILIIFIFLFTFSVLAEEVKKGYDYHTSEPVRLSDAFYVIQSGVNTPMGYGIIAFKNRNRAEGFLKESKKGRILSYQELLRIKLK